MKSLSQKNQRGQAWPWIGQSRLGAALLTMLETDQWPATVMFIGPAHVGKASIARWLAQRDICRQASAPCQTCADCHAVVAGTHPDCFVVSWPDNQQLGTDDIHQALQGLTWKRERQAAGRRWVIIPEVDCLSEHVSNALLKLIEEPPVGTVVVMTTSHPEVVLPTIRSRAVQFRWQSVPNTELDDYLRTQWSSLSATTRRTILAQADGRPGLMIMLAQDPTALEREWQATTELLTAVADGRLPDRSDWAMADLDRLERIVRDGMVTLIRGQAKYWPERTDDFRHFASRLGATRLVALAQRLTARQPYLRQHVQPSLFLHDLIL